MESNDPLGHKLLEKRFEQCSDLIQSILVTPIQPLKKCTGQFIVTGIGSSEAHARFFTYLINKYGKTKTYTANFYNLSEFYNLKNDTKKYQNSTLVVFSQGLSPNAQLAINQRSIFKKLILFTATHGELPNHLAQEKHQVIYFPPEKEYDLLLRIQGPLTGYLTILQALKPWINIPHCEDKILMKITQKYSNPKSKQAFKNKLNIIKNMKKNSIILLPPSTIEYGQNLAYKFLEGLFFPLPTIVDFLSFAHGYFQQLISNPKPVIILSDNTFKKTKLYQNTLKLLTSHLGKQWIMEIHSTLPTPWTIFEYEMIFNNLILQGIKKYKINQKDWPGKGLDGPIYNINKPQTS